MRKAQMELKDHIRAVASFSLDPFNEEALLEATREVEESIAKAKAGETTLLKADIWNAAAIFVGLEKKGRLDATKAYPALRACIAHIISTCPGIRRELVIMFAPFPNLNAALL
ncbi:MAG: hypothetical protein A3C93_00460 [Candidatus Lloydbacteria bacterium RIFCSPHIGHO2_02_FULL_54_17]|uniref:Uncharacterized protein n=1 Tax=Candidatus Lloydbacteria bacterium RIFCSPHIGHO2_02_FULL_54_17 TaxID=1798664 RepID=A0A1G2DE08_9BACT|nr:MAG: hypothetical protein A2762_01840 [Candidatus Lloydbacteria bacterium RIFCSPHIGHO2_01_FULL_54_11]OGZ11859.1 MAG: hypothetical protein A3C93_00460 [Candidatus Lloydbacteria bacterium RIFCSPHIGHO2_02_FULL_54_17]OGZ14120.1 MAG: hypothetical protein A2948_03325 [Candidatus Lloydbacteria bacterium RIFCSPLOWO2_01_FULL_54_18]OGZ16703.1 MAG: hypothetical protein A3H76_00165 [Candidatus Lloydbacteria bacterium RIFCSPLOWO2_02_FULL_54_12]